MDFLHERYEIKADTHAKAVKDIAYLICGHFFGESKQDITVVLDKEDTLELLKDINTSLYDEVLIDTKGEYFIITSCVGHGDSILFVENVYTEQGILKYHETDILILPSYLPQHIRKHLLDGGYDKAIEITLKSIYEDLVKIIEN
jgi:hypothetical protein